MHFVEIGPQSAKTLILHTTAGGSICMSVRLGMQICITVIMSKFEESRKSVSRVLEN